MFKDETLDKLEKFCFRGNPARSELDSKNSIMEQVLYTHSSKKYLFKVSYVKENLFIYSASKYFRFQTIRYWECVKRFSNVDITDRM